jgi:hypothetical protein
VRQIARHDADNDSTAGIPAAQISRAFLNLHHRVFTGVISLCSPVNPVVTNLGIAEDVDRMTVLEESDCCNSALG